MKQNAIFDCWGRSRFWWMLLALGLTIATLGLWSTLDSRFNYADFALFMDYAILAAGVLQLTVAFHIGHGIPGWGWCVTSSGFDVAASLLLVTHVLTSQGTLLFAFAMVFLFKGIASFVGGFALMDLHRHWWAYVLNGCIKLSIAWLFLMHPFFGTCTLLLICDIVLLYWGISLIFFAFDLRPKRTRYQLA